MYGNILDGWGEKREMSGGVSMFIIMNILVFIKIRVFLGVQLPLVKLYLEEYFHRRDDTVFRK